MTANRRVAVPTALLGLFALLAIYLGHGMTAANAAYYLSRRLPQVATIIVGASGLGVAATVFQTVTQNRLLTPSVLGIDMLYVLIQTVVVFFSGAEALVLARPQVGYLLSVTIMGVFVVVVLRPLFAGRDRGVAQVLLLGIVMGILFRSISSFLQMVIDPNEFSVIQDSVFASVNNVGTPVLLPAIPVWIAALVWLSFALRDLDAIALGREHAIALGVSYDSVVVNVLAPASVLVASATALIGPLPFLGLLASNVTRQFSPAWRHRVMLPASAIVATAALLGLDLLRRLTGSAVPLGTTIQLIGGVLFIVLLVHGERR